MTLTIEVWPNPYNESGSVFIVYKKLFWKFKTELGRVVTEDQLLSFIKLHSRYDGQVVE